MPRHATIKPVSIETYEKWVNNIVPQKCSLYLSTVSYDDDGPGASKPRTIRLSRTDIIDQLKQDYKESGLNLTGKTYKVRPPKNMGDIRYLITQFNGADSEWGTAWVEDKKEHKERVRKQEKAACENIAGLISQKYNVKVGTVNFITAAKKHYKSIIDSERHFRDDPECRAERYAMCVMGGAGRDSFYEDNDYSSSQISNSLESINRLLNYISKYHPLAMLEYREKCLAKKNRNKG